MGADSDTIPNPFIMAGLVDRQEDLYALSSFVLHPDAFTGSIRL